MGGLVATAIGGVFATLFGLVANIAATLTGALLGMAVWLFNWVCSPSFISLSYTDPARNPFIKLGWELTRDLTNIFFVIALVVIGLGTALRLGGYQVKKALPTLIIIALLVNFTPVICGLIVDASNIVMNFFVQGGFAGGNSFANYAVSQWSSVKALAGGLKFWDPTSSSDAIAAAMGSIVLIFFNFLAALIYILFALIFILRYIAIWILVILSPFAFACYILPATKSVWSQWWKMFIQWSIIGAIAAFFLYLGDHFMRTALSSGFITSSGEEIANAPGIAPIMNRILPYFISLILLFIGLFASLSFAPKGADAILKAGMKGEKAARGVFGKRVWAGAVATAKAPGKVLGGPALRAGREAFRIHRGLGKSRKQALGAAIERGWTATRLETGWRARAGIKAAPGAAMKGTWKAIKDSAKAGWGAALGKSKKRKGEKCQACGNTLPNDADFCPRCGARF